MKKYLILFLLLVSSSVIKSQTCSLDYVNIRFGIDKTLKESSFINNNFGIQIGRFFTDMWGAELDVQKGIKHNGLSNFSIGTNLIYQYTNYDINITPFVKIGGAYKNYSFDENIEKDKCHCFDSKFGFGANMPISNLISMNFGINYHHIFTGPGWGMINKDILETEIGICILLY